MLISKILHQQVVVTGSVYYDVERCFKTFVEVGENL